MAEAFDTRELGEALDDSAATAAPPSTSTPQRPPPPIDVLSYDVLVSIFVALEDPDWVRRTIPLVCKAWNELYCSKDASPLHEKLEVDFAKEVETAVEAGGKGTPPLVHGSRVISWAEKRAGSVRELYITGVEDGATKDFSFKEMGKLVTVAAPSLTDLAFDFDLYVRSQVEGELRRARGGRYVFPDLKPFWKAVRDSVAPKGRLRSLGVAGADFSECDLEPLGRLAGSLEKLALGGFHLGGPQCPKLGDPGIPWSGIWMPRFPEVLCDLTELRCLNLVHQRKIMTIPAKISSLKKLEELRLDDCRLFLLPKELGELSALTWINLPSNTLGFKDNAFPAALGRMKSLRALSLRSCCLRAVPAFVGELPSLEVLVLNSNGNLGDAPQRRAFPSALGRMKSLYHLHLEGCGLRAVPSFVSELASLATLMLSKNEKLGDAPELRAFPAALGEMTSLGRLDLDGCGLRAVPAFVSELASLGLLKLDENENLGAAPQDKAFPAALGKMKSLGHVHLKRCGLRAVPAFVSELASLEVLNLDENENLGAAPQGKAFPAAKMRKMRSLRELWMFGCGLRAFPAFIGELESLEVLDLRGNDFQVDAAALRALLKRCRSLREVALSDNDNARPWTAESLANLDAFKARLLAENPGAKVMY